MNPLIKEQIKSRVFSKLGETNFEKNRYTTQERGISNMLNNVIGKYVVAAVVAVVLISGSAYASADARPGDTLFPLKKATEKVQLALSASSESKAELHARIAQERLEDIAKVSVENKTAAQSEAKVELATAIEVLTEVQAKLEARGNTTAAAALAGNITRLKTIAANQNFKVKVEIEQDSNDAKVEIEIEEEDEEDEEDEDSDDEDEEDQDDDELKVDID